MKWGGILATLVALGALSACGSGGSDDPVKTLQDAGLCTGFQAPQPEDQATNGTTTLCTFDSDGTNAVIYVNRFNSESDRDAYVQAATVPYSVVGQGGNTWWSINLSVYGGTAAVDIPDSVIKAFPNDQVVH